MADWYYAARGTRRGPVTDEELTALAAAGGLARADLVWRDGMAAWVKAARVKGLFPPAAPPPLPPAGPPPLPLPAATETSDPDPVPAWEAWQVWVFSLATLGLFNLYLIPSWARPVERITGERRLPFWAVLLLGVLTLGVSLAVTEVVYAFALQRHGRAAGRSGARPHLGVTVLVLDVVAWVWSLATGGVGFFVGGAVLKVAATWLVQAEINTYADDLEPDGPDDLDGPADRDD